MLRNLVVGDQVIILSGKYKSKKGIVRRLAGETVELDLPTVVPISSDGGFNVDVRNYVAKQIDMFALSSQRSLHRSFFGPAVVSGFPDGLKSAMKVEPDAEVKDATIQLVEIYESMDKAAPVADVPEKKGPRKRRHRIRK